MIIKTKTKNVWNRHFFKSDRSHVVLWAKELKGKVVSPQPLGHTTFLPAAASNLGP